MRLDSESGSGRGGRWGRVDEASCMGRGLAAAVPAAVPGPGGRAYIPAGTKLSKGPVPGGSGQAANN